ncbi:PhzF family phenazine biosynthesis protein [Bacilli bacterium PM5-9]|nr:PhzF family phenazine biosynthesis protein [Bacilli bacterium PM5-9]
MNMEAYEVSAFTRENEGGNLAGVVIMDNLLSENEMQEIATKFGYSETAFVEIFEENIFNVRFFTVTNEVDLCGHATIATFHLLKEKGYITKKEAFQYTKAGKLKVICDNNILMEMSKPVVKNDLDKDQCADLLSINPDEIINKPKIVEVGLPDAMVVVKDYQVLEKIKMKKDEVTKFSNDNEITGFHVATIEKGNYYVRNFAPACGIDEESATGTANGGMFVYLQSKGYIKGDEQISFKQGDLMNLPSEIVVKQIDDIIWVGGKATIIKELSI